MKQIILIFILIVGAFYWLSEWASSGRMDNFIDRHRNPETTPQILYLIGEGCHLSQMPKPASHYLRWLITDYPDFKKADKVRWDLGQCYEDLQRRDLAKQQYAVLRDSYPATEYGQKGFNRLQQFSF